MSCPVFISLPLSMYMDVYMFMSLSFSCVRIPMPVWLCSRFFYLSSGWVKKSTKNMYAGNHPDFTQTNNMYASQFSQGLNNARLSKENTAYKAPTQPNLLLSSLFFSASDGCKIYQKYVLHQLVPRTLTIFVKT